MYAGQYRFTFFPLPFDQCQMLLTCIFLTESHQFEIAIFSRHIYPYFFLDQAFFFQSVRDQVFNRDNFQIKLFCDLQQFW
ncbi:hypothetical protein D3C72_685480 [compost metagenome]